MDASDGNLSSSSMESTDLDQMGEEALLMWTIETLEGTSSTPLGDDTISIVAKRPEDFDAAIVSNIGILAAKKKNWPNALAIVKYLVSVKEFAGAASICGAGSRLASEAEAREFEALLRYMSKKGHFVSRVYFLENKLSFLGALRGFITVPARLLWLPKAIVIAMRDPQDYRISSVKGINIKMRKY